MQETWFNLVPIHMQTLQTKSMETIAIACTDYSVCELLFHMMRADAEQRWGIHNTYNT